MPICYVLGGLGESVLSTFSADVGIVWVNATVLLLGQAGKMRLAPNGIDPGSPDGIALVAPTVVDPYVGFPALLLGVQLLSQGYSVRVHGWDWRKRIYPAGQDLAVRIRREVTTDAPCSIVAHSAGGLVARAAWTDLGITGDQGLVRRIITLGTPHWGSYVMVQFFCGSNQSIDIMKYWNQTVGYNTAGWAPALTGYIYLDDPFYQNLAMTWPACYEVLPVIGAPGADLDPNRVQLYDAANWPEEARPQQAWLDYARDVTGPWLRSAASQPPPEVLTCVSGSASTTASALVDPSKLGGSGCTGDYVTGDGAVTQASAELATSVVYRFTVNHENLLPTLVNQGEIADLVLDVRSPGPPPPPVVETEILPQSVAPIPGSLLPQPVGVVTFGCATGACSC
jgi:hypothetical protein